jgi:hypothetical protein
MALDENQWGLSRCVLSQWAPKRVRRILDGFSVCPLLRLHSPVLSNALQSFTCGFAWRDRGRLRWLFRINRAMHDWHQLLRSPDSGSPAECALTLAIWVPLPTLVWWAANGPSRSPHVPSPYAAVNAQVWTHQGTDCRRLSCYTLHHAGICSYLIMDSFVGIPAAGGGGSCRGRRRRQWRQGHDHRAQ